MKPDDIKARDESETAIGEKLGPVASAEYFESDPDIVTLTLYQYEDDKEHQNHMTEVDGIMPEAMENYIGADIMVSHGDTVTQVSLRRRKCDVEVNAIGRANMNTILDTRAYEVEFEDGSMSTYSASVIKESMYAQCYEEEQQYLLFG